MPSPAPAAPWPLALHPNPGPTGLHGGPAPGRDLTQPPLRARGSQVPFELSAFVPATREPASAHFLHPQTSLAT